MSSHLKKKKDILCKFCSKVIDNKNRFIYEPSNENPISSSNGNVCDSPGCLVKLVKNEVVDDNADVIVLADDEEEADLQETDEILHDDDELVYDDNSSDIGTGQRQSKRDQQRLNAKSSDDSEIFEVEFLETVEESDYELQAIKLEVENVQARNETKRLQSAETVEELEVADELIEDAEELEEFEAMEEVKYEDEEVEELIEAEIIEDAEIEEEPKNQETPEVNKVKPANVKSAPRKSEYLEVEYLDSMDLITPHQYLEDIELESLRNSAYKSEKIKNIKCKVCEIKCDTIVALIEHIVEEHTICETQHKSYKCTMVVNCKSFVSLTALTNHIFSEHLEIATSSKQQILIHCPRCCKSFESHHLFGKHMCQVIYLDEVKKNLECVVCSKILPSRRRLLFHHQFHIENPRPKICLVCMDQFSNDVKFFDHVMFAHEFDPVFPCDNCDRLFDLNENLMIHRTSHTKERNFICGTCGSAFLDNVTLEAHFLKQHTNINPFTCKICGKGFVKKTRYNYHLLSHEELKPATVIACNECGLVFRKKTELILHGKTEHGDGFTLKPFEFQIDRIFNCQYCERPFKSATGLNEHRKIHAGDQNPYICEFCPKRCTQYGALRSHMQRHQKEIETQIPFPVQRHYLCHFEDCMRSYNNFSRLSMHLRSTHKVKVSGATVNKVTCNICGEQFLESWRLPYHKKKVHPQSDINEDGKCTLCGEGFRNRATLKHHQMQKHKDELEICKACNQKKFVFPGKEHECIKCTKCNKGFNTPKMLERHNLATHNEENNLNEYEVRCEICKQKIDLVRENIHKCKICDHCGQSFVRNTDLTKHMAAMHNFKSDASVDISKTKSQTQCYICEKKFVTNTTLLKHIKTIHVGIKPKKNEKTFKCHLCDYMGRCQAYLNDHLVTHTQDRPFVCPHCNIAFKRSYTLKKHEQRFHSNKQIMCEQCPEIFTSEYLLQQHKNQMHSGVIKRKRVKKADSEVVSFEIMDVEDFIVGDTIELVNDFEESETIKEVHVCGQMSTEVAMEIDVVND